MNRIKRLIIATAVMVLASCGGGYLPPAQPTVPVVPPATVELNDPTFPSQCKHIWQQELRRPIDPVGLAECVQQFKAGVSGETIRYGVRLSKEYMEVQAAIEEAKKVKPTPRLHVEGDYFADPTGKRVRLALDDGLTLLTLSPEARDKKLDEIKANGFGGFRVFSGTLTWAGQTVESARANLPGLLTAAIQRGLYVLVTINTDSGTGYDVKFHTEHVVQLLTTFSNTIAECANEYYHPTQSKDVNDVEWLFQMCTAAFKGTNVPWAIGAPSFDEPTPEGTWPIPSGDFITSHLDRSRDTWNQVRRVRELYAIKEVARKPVFNSEPMGCAETDVPGRRIANTSFHFALGALNRLFEISGVFHSEDGLYSRLLGPNQTKCAKAFVEGTKSIPTDKLLSYQNVGWTGSPVASARFADSGGSIVRAYSFTDGGTAFTIILHTGSEFIPQDIEWRLDWATRTILTHWPNVTILQVSK